MKRIYINLLLSVCAIALAFACCMSIWTEVSFDQEKTARENKVKQALMNIRDAQEKFKMTHRGEYCGDIDSLIDFVKNGKTIDKIIKEGVLTDEQLEEGMTEEKALEMKLPGFVRDTVWVSTAEMLGIKNPDSMKYVPVGKKGALIQMRKKPAFNLKSNEWEVLIEIRASLDDYLDGMDAKKIKNLKIDLKKAGKNRADLFEDNADDTEGNWYGLKIGDLNDPSNKNAGNWE